MVHLLQSWRELFHQQHAESDLLMADDGKIFRAGACIVVLGMHRSGTSALTGSLMQAGMYLGKVLDTAISHNPKGLQEPASILYMHEHLLQASGGSWSDPPSQVVWDRLHCAVRDLFIESRGGHAVWGFKDPRTVFTLQGWLDVLPDIRPVGIFRHPYEVAASLRKRNGFELEKGLSLWALYNRKLLKWRDRLGFPIIPFTADHALMKQKLAALMGQLGLEPADETDFFNPSLLSTCGETPPLPADVLEVLENLQSRAL
ncbi:MAG: hypothetical protein KIS81_07750 [Maricaulaceae bacterium]|nr:hypothetical protein [Maricaulaceae bacterium]